MSWFHYVGSHVHNFCDTDNGYFLEGGKGEQLLPGREIRYRCECTVPSAGEYTLQFELDTRIRLRINEIPVDYSRGIRLKGFLPQTAWKFRRTGWSCCTACGCGRACVTTGRRNSIW